MVDMAQAAQAPSQPRFPRANAAGLTATLDAVSELITSGEAAREVHGHGGTASAATLLCMVHVFEPTCVEALCRAVLAMLAPFVALSEPGGGPRRACVDLSADADVNLCIAGVLNAMALYDRTEQIQADALIELVALLSHARGGEAALLERALGLALDALVRHPNNGVIAERAMLLFLSALSPQQSGSAPRPSRGSPPPAASASRKVGARALPRSWPRSSRCCRCPSTGRCKTSWCAVRTRRCSPCASTARWSFFNCSSLRTSATCSARRRAPRCSMRATPALRSASPGGRCGRRAVAAAGKAETSAALVARPPGSSFVDARRHAPL
jgi:hypothetical protein